MSSKDKKKNRIPKITSTPPGREIRVKENPVSTENQTPAWQFHLCDNDHPLWGWGKLTDEQFIDLVKNDLHDHEKMHWSQIISAAGGRKSGTNNHPLPTSGFTSNAQKRLKELKLDGYEELFSLRLNGTLRLYGIREGRVLRFIWHDPYHGSKDEAYPTKK